MPKAQRLNMISEIIICQRQHGDRLIPNDTRCSVANYIHPIQRSAVENKLMTKHLNLLFSIAYAGWYKKGLDRYEHISIYS